jgi:hypothetical protein
MKTYLNLQRIVIEDAFQGKISLSRHDWQIRSNWRGIPQCIKIAVSKLMHSSFSTHLARGLKPIRVPHTMFIIMLRNRILLPALALLSLLFVSCERLEDAPSGLATAVDLDTTGRSTFILVDRSTKGAHRYIDPNGKVLFGGETYYQAFPFRFGYGVVSKLIDGKIHYGVLDQSGKTIIPIQHRDPIFSYEGGLFKTGMDRIGYLDTTGKAVIPMDYIATKGVQDGFVTVKNATSKWGILNVKGETIAPFEFLEIGSWSDGLAAVSIVSGNSAKWGFLNQSGEIVIPCVYDYATDFEQGIAMVKQGKKFGLMDAAGQAVTPLEFDDFQMVATVEPNSGNRNHPPRTKLQLISPTGQISVSKGGVWMTVGVDGKVNVAASSKY